jgi:hypothetical protein
MSSDAGNPAGQGTNQGRRGGANMRDVHAAALSA